MNVALYFGSFNPIHKAHIAITRFVASLEQFDEVWLVVSPQNPLKSPKELACEVSRIDMARMAFADDPHKNKILISEVEFSLPKPSYTINTLRWLSDKYPQHSFSLVIGQDNLQRFKQWRDWQEIVNNYKLMVYPRQGGGLKDMIEHKNIVLMMNAPLYAIDSTSIRDCVKNGIPFDSITTKEVAEYIKKQKLYE